MYNEKITVLKGISELVHTSVEKANEKIKLEKNISTLLGGLSIDAYISDFQKKHMFYKETLQNASSMSNGTTGTSVDEGITLEGLEKDKRQLEKENEKLNFTNTMLKTEYDEKLTEANNSKREIEKKYEILVSERNDLKDENKKLQKYLQEALCKVETIKGEIFFQQKFYKVLSFCILKRRY